METEYEGPGSDAQKAPLKTVKFSEWLERYHIYPCCGEKLCFGTSGGSQNTVYNLVLTSSAPSGAYTLLGGEKPNAERLGFGINNVFASLQHAIDILNSRSGKYVTTGSYNGVSHPDRWAVARGFGPKSNFVTPRHIRMDTNSLLDPPTTSSEHIVLDKENFGDHIKDTIERAIICGKHDFIDVTGLATYFSFEDLKKLSGVKLDSFIGVVKEYPKEFGVDFDSVHETSELDIF